MSLDRASLCGVNAAQVAFIILACPKGGDPRPGSILPAPCDQQYQPFYSGS